MEFKCAYALSRCRSTSSEMKIEVTTFKCRISSGVKPLRDLFATKANTPLLIYVSPIFDSEAGVSTMNIDWNVWTQIFLFPFIIILEKVIP